MNARHTDLLPQAEALLRCTAIVAVVLCGPQSLCGTPTPTPAAPPVGFVQIVVPSNGYTLVSMPFEPFDPSLNAVLGGQLTGTTSTNTCDQLLRWIPASQAYTTAWRANGLADSALNGRWIQWAGATPTLSPLMLSVGDAFWLQSRQSYDQRAFVAGRVPMAIASSVLLVPGVNLAGYPYATSLPINSATLQACGSMAASAPEWAEHDFIYRWREFPNQVWGYSLYSLWDSAPEENWLGGWYGGENFDSLTTDRISLGAGFWYKRDPATNAFVWTEPRPYADVFGTTNTLPRVTELTVSASVPCATLTIQAQPGTDWPVDILTLDAAADGSFATTGWSKAARVPSLGQASFTWSDLPGNGHLAVTNVHARFYLAARADLDADLDGLADALETHVHQTNPAVPDSDSDRIPDGWELANGFDPLNPASRSTLLRVDNALGNDTNDGYSAPVRRITVGLTRARTGDTVVVAPGIYGSEPTTLSPTTGTTHLRPLGTVRIR